MKSVWTWFKRIIAMGVFLAVALFVGLGFVAKYVGSTSPPSVADAPFMIQTSSYVYYAASFTSVGGYPAIRTYWVDENGHYKKYSLKSPLVFGKGFGQVNVITRPGK